MGGVIEIGNVKQAGDVVGALSHTNTFKKAAGSTRTRKRSSFLSKRNEQLEVAAKPTGVNLFSHWDISLYIGSGYEETV